MLSVLFVIFSLRAVAKAVEAEDREMRISSIPTTNFPSRSPVQSPNISCAEILA